jgi:tetratricopeptide (TPR) repeat protein
MPRKIRHPALTAGAGDNSCRRREKPARISACLIVKNEEALLPRCLASLHGLADEIILVDTGSTDATLAIAERFGCCVLHFPWSGDFSAARNESLAHAAGEWVFVIDADEEVPSEDKETILTTVNRPDLNLISVSVYNRSLDSGAVSSVLPSIRLFRRTLQLRYEGIVHNRLCLPAGAAVFRSTARLYHYGYDLPKERLEQKRARSRALLEEQLRRDPDDLFAHFNLAQLLRGMGGENDPTACEQIIQHAYKVIDHPQSPSPACRGYRLMAMHQAASALAALQRWTEAEEIARRALSEKPDYLDVMMTLGRMHLTRGNLAEAARWFREYLRVRETYRPDREGHDIILHYWEGRHIAWYALGAMAEHEGKVDEALDCYAAVLRYMSPYLDTGYRMGMLYLRADNSTRAEEMFRQELSFRPNSVEALFGLAQSLIHRGALAEAVAPLERAAALAPDNGIIQFHLGKTLMRTGQTKTGRACFDKSLQRLPNNYDFVFEAANSIFDGGDVTRAMALYQQALALRPGDRDALNNLGNCHFKMEQFEKAAVVYETLLRDHPDYLNARRNLGLARARLGNTTEALTALMQYVERAPEDIETFGLLGDLFLETGYCVEATGCYEKYLAARPDDTARLLNLAEAYYRQGYIDAARAGYREVLRRDPGCLLARERLAGESISVTC